MQASKSVRVEQVRLEAGIISTPFCLSSNNLRCNRVLRAGKFRRCYHAICESSFQMTVERITRLRLLRLVIGLKISLQFFQPMRSKTQTIRTLYTRFEQVTGNFLGILIRSSPCLLLL